MPGGRTHDTHINRRHTPHRRARTHTVVRAPSLSLGIVKGFRQGGRAGGFFAQFSVSGKDDSRLGGQGPLELAHGNRQTVIVVFRHSCKAKTESPLCLIVAQTSEQKRRPPLSESRRWGSKVCCVCECVWWCRGGKNTNATSVQNEAAQNRIHPLRVPPHIHQPPHTLSSLTARRPRPPRGPK